MQVLKNVQKTRYKQLQNKGINGNFAQILADKERDFRDRNVEVAPLKPADDALLLDSTTLSIDERLLIRR